MKNFNSKLKGFSVEALEERKEFCFYICFNPCHNHGNGEGDGDGGN